MSRSFHFAPWVQYFADNQKNLRPIDVDDPDILTPTERDTIRSSIQQFQVGESSEGRFLLDKANQYLAGHEDQSYLEAVTLFIKEEQRHARTLKEFMDKQDIPVIQRHWVDRVFRRLRRPFNLEVSITVLITAEIIAAIYYQALRQATKSRHLIQLCDQILLDEDKHIEFQSETLRKLLSSQSRLHYWMHRFAHRILLEGTLCVVWLYHRKVLTAGGYEFGTFVSECRKVYRWSNGMIDRTS